MEDTTTPTTKQTNRQDGTEKPASSPPTTTRTLVWQNLCLTPVDKHNKKHKKDDATPPVRPILDHVWGQVPTGQVTAILGPSGSGKTSLLNVLSGRVVNSSRVHVQADVQLHRGTQSFRTVDPSDLDYRRHIAFVAQDDSLPTTATPREAIGFSARLRLPRTTSGTEVEQLVEAMLTSLRLQDCADTFVGGALVKGISGGERKRTAVGVELVTKPRLVFLDEPTSGLDSFNAQELCQVLQTIAQQQGAAVLLTIHQPGSALLGCFDRFLLLNQGRCMYEGPRQCVVPYFGARGYPIPDHYNPADYIMTVAQTTPIEQLVADGFFVRENGRNDSDVEKGTSASPKFMHQETPPSEHELVVETKDRIGLLVQTRCLFAREVRTFQRNKKLLGTRTAMTFFISIMGGVLFWQVGDSDYSSFINVQTTFGGVLVALLANVFSTAVPSLVALPEERPIFIREYSTNHYSVAAYFLAKLVMEAVVTAVQVTVSLTITYYFMDLSAPYLALWTALYVMAMTSTALGLLVGSAVKDPGVAMEFLPAIFMPQILLSGFFVPPDLIPVWICWVGKIFPLTYAMLITLIVELDGRCDAIVDEEGGPNHCDQVLRNINADPDDLWFYWIVLCSEFVVFRLLALTILERKARRFY